MKAGQRGRKPLAPALSHHGQFSSSCLALFVGRVLLPRRGTVGRPRAGCAGATVLRPHGDPGPSADSPQHWASETGMEVVTEGSHVLCITLGHSDSSPSPKKGRTREPAGVHGPGRELGSCVCVCVCLCVCARMRWGGDPTEWASYVDSSDHFCFLRGLDRT